MRSKPKGFTLIELMIALAFLVLATGLFMRLLQATSEQDRLAWYRLTKQMAVENISQRLSAYDYVEMPEAVENLKREISEQDPKATLTIEIQTFESQQRKGWHGIVSDESKLGKFCSHFWRLEDKE